MSRLKPKSLGFARCLWGLSAFAALLLVLKYFVADVYHINSGSMRPTLMGGAALGESKSFDEWILVRYGSGQGLERYDLVVVDRPGKPALIKRVLGLPGESIRIVDGDVFIDGARPAREAKRPAPIPVFDSRLHPVSDQEGFGFSVESGPGGPWSEQRGVWMLKGSQIGLGRDTGRSTGMMHYRPDVRDGYIDQNGKRIAGSRSVNDLVLECEVAVDALAGRLRFQLTEAGDLFEARLRQDPEKPGSQLLELIRSRLGTKEAHVLKELEIVEASLELELPEKEWLRVQFSNLDNCVSFKIETLNVELYFYYESNERFPGKPAHGDQNVGVRVGFGGEGIEARFRSIQILRDLHYTAPVKTTVAQQQEVPEAQEELTYLGPGELYLLGDNSSQSIDSRSQGAYALETVVGRPLCVVWPLWRWRSL